MHSTKMDNAIVAKDLILKKLNLAVQNRINTEELSINELHTDVYYDTLAQDMLARVSYFVWAGDDETVKISVPSTWFQQWKYEKAPKWFTDRYPVIFKDIEINVQPYFPILRKLAKDNRAEIRFRVLQN